MGLSSLESLQRARFKAGYERCTHGHLHGGYGEVSGTDYVSDAGVRFSHDSFCFKQ